MGLFAPIAERGDDGDAIAALARRIAVELEGHVAKTHVARARTLYRERRIRARHFAGSLFAEPVWDLLLDLFIAGQDGIQVSVSSACLAAHVPTTTALRYIQWLVEHRLAERYPHPDDGRSTLLRTTETANRAMIAYLDEIV
jgi:hypothetical protein